MQCPYCGSEMQPGVISFCIKNKTVWKSNDDSKEIKKIVVADSFDNNEMDAAFSNNCKKMILDLGELKKPEPLFVFIKPRDNGTFTR